MFWVFFCRTKVYSLLVNPIFTGAWDGSHLWFQWLPDPASPIYQIRVSFGDRVRNFSTNRSWMHIALPEAGGKEITATVDGVPTVEASFGVPRCKFKWRAGDYPVSHAKDILIAARVDGAVCGYKLLESIDLSPGESCVTEMIAHQQGPWAQLDHPDHFSLSLPGGGQVHNLEPSRSDYELTGASSTRLSFLPPGPFILITQ